MNTLFLIANHILHNSNPCNYISLEQFFIKKTGALGQLAMSTPKTCNIGFYNICFSIFLWFLHKQISESDMNWKIWMEKKYL